MKRVLNEVLANCLSSCSSGFNVNLSFFCWVLCVFMVHAYGAERSVPSEDLEGFGVLNVVSSFGLDGDYSVPELSEELCCAEILPKTDLKGQRMYDEGLFGEGLSEEETEDPDQSSHEQKEKNFFSEGRRSVLLKILCAKKVCFEDVANDLYQDSRRFCFSTDILELMHRGALICVEDGKLICRGHINVNDCHPKKDVAAAMLELLHGGCRNWFWMRFKLYEDGYRKNSLTSLGHLEWALVVCGLHPCVRKMLCRDGSVSLPILQKIWRDHRHESSSVFKQSLCGLKDYYRRTLWQLWKLQKRGALASLENFQPSGDPLPCDKARCFVGERWECVMRCWKHHKNKEFSALEIARMADVTLDRRGGEKEFLRYLLNFVLEGYPIVYNKERKTLTLLEKQSAPYPVPGTNIMTSLYDALNKYAGDLCTEETAYYVFLQGHWTSTYTEHLFKRNHFHQMIKQYKHYLGILRFVSVGCFNGKQQVDLDRHQKLWDTLKGWRFSADFDDRMRKGGIPDKDRDVLLGLRNFVCGPSYVVFKNHAAVLHEALPNEDILKAAVMEEDSLVHCLIAKCKKRGIMSFGAFWKAANALTKFAGPGRLRYNPDTRYFYWDAAGKTPDLTSRDYSAAALMMRTRYHYLDGELFVFMLHQDGFVRASVNDLRVVLQSLRVLGLLGCSVRVAKLEVIREFLNLLLERDCSYAQVMPLTKNRDGSYNRIAKICRRLESWVRDDDIMAELWRAHLICVSESANRAKKRGSRDVALKHVVRHNIPALQARLAERKLWWEGALTQKI